VIACLYSSSHDHSIKDTDLNPSAARIISVSLQLRGCRYLNLDELRICHGVLLKAINSSVTVSEACNHGNVVFRLTDVELSKVPSICPRATPEQVSKQYALELWLSKLFQMFPSIRKLDLSYCAMKGCALVLVFVFPILMLAVCADEDAQLLSAAIGRALGSDSLSAPAYVSLDSVKLRGLQESCSASSVDAVLSNLCGVVSLDKVELSAL
jgi:hypothetical protein